MVFSAKRVGYTKKLDIFSMYDDGGHTGSGFAQGMYVS